MEAEMKKIEIDELKAGGGKEKYEELITLIERVAAETDSTKELVGSSREFTDITSNKILGHLRDLETKQEHRLVEMINKQEALISHLLATHNMEKEAILRDSHRLFEDLDKKLDNIVKLQESAVRVEAENLTTKESMESIVKLLHSAVRVEAENLTTKKSMDNIVEPGPQGVDGVLSDTDHSISAKGSAGSKPNLDTRVQKADLQPKKRRRLSTDAVEEKVLKPRQHELLLDIYSTEPSKLELTLSTNNRFFFKLEKLLMLKIVNFEASEIGFICQLLSGACVKSHPSRVLVLIFDIMYVLVDHPLLLQAISSILERSGPIQLSKPTIQFMDSYIFGIYEVYRNHYSENQQKLDLGRGYYTLISNILGLTEPGSKIEYFDVVCDKIVAEKEYPVFNRRLIMAFYNILASHLNKA
ncbi:hypothetical protein AX774_g7222 [Zancudomyces culisetae]|uniref:Uncharacterized protein n=1 Tax=Zancudomyces culisetae TaxID=1213189 RepID=A0A1R1PEH6_ZANCU|nr:hypothetical protein AX774_g7222 [Zancudomyces culisetae]|eukprot:OMH79361.1 hypothetical protein AX774_g7222 [Zancudomyces culisetae]